MRKFFVLSLMLMFLAGCGRSAPVQKFSKSGEFFKTFVRLDVCYADGQQKAVQEAVDQIWDRFADIHWRLSVYDPDSDLNRLNRAYPEPAVVGADTYALIRESVSYYALSDGMFDITIYPILKAWKAAEKKGVLPTADDIRAAQVSAGMDKIRMLDKNRVQLTHAETKVSIDSIADGYAADEAGRILRARGFSRFLIDTSGELLAGGRNCEGRPWRVGVRSPDRPDGIVDVLAVENTSVTTSGSYEHYYTIGDRRYSHIINPRTGFPRDDIVSATVIAPSAEFSDFLSTALCLLDPQKGADLVDSLGESYASMVIVQTGPGVFVKKASRHYGRFLAGR